MVTATSDRISTNMEVLESNPKAKMLSHKVRVHFHAKTGNEFNIRMSLHSLMRSMVDLDKSTNFKDVLGKEVSKDSVEPESEKKRAKGSITEISNSGDGSDAEDETMEEVNVKKKLPFDDIQENPKTRKDETMVPLPSSHRRHRYHHRCY